MTTRRDILKAAGTGAGLLLGVPTGAEQDLHAATPTRGQKTDFDPVRPDVAVVGAGAFGLWTAHYLNRLGAKVTVVDLYGPGNSRSSSGDETRGVKSSYGNRVHGLQWSAWVRQALDRWQRWDSEWRDGPQPRLYFETGDLTLRQGMDTALERSISNWDELGIEYERLTPAEARRRFPTMRSDGFDVAVFEPAAGVLRSRRALEAVADVFESEGGEMIIDRVLPPDEDTVALQAIRLESGRSISADSYVFACGPWLAKVLPDTMGNKLRTPMGHVYYVGTPPGDLRFTYPNSPSFDVPEATAWPALTVDNRGFRFRTGGRLLEDPDESERRIPDRHIHDARVMLKKYFPDLADAPLLETRSAHYQYSTDSNLIVDRHPTLDNAWIMGGGSAESFKFGPVLGEYAARRILGIATDAGLDEGFRLKDAEFPPYPSHKDEEPGWLDRKLDEYCHKRI